MLITARKSIHKRQEETSRRSYGNDGQVSTAIYTVYMHLYMEQQQKKTPGANDLQFFGVYEGCVNRLHGTAGKSVTSSHLVVIQQPLQGETDGSTLMPNVSGNKQNR